MAMLNKFRIQFEIRPSYDDFWPLLLGIPPAGHQHRCHAAVHQAPVEQDRVKTPSIRHHFWKTTWWIWSMFSKNGVWSMFSRKFFFKQWNASSCMVCMELPAKSANFWTRKSFFSMNTIGTRWLKKWIVELQKFSDFTNKVRWLGEQWTRNQPQLCNFQWYSITMVVLDEAFLEILAIVRASAR